MTKPLFTYYGMDGEEITMEEFNEIVSDPEKKRVAYDVLPDGKVVSTVLLGMDHRWSGEGPPIIFESMVFKSATDYSDLDMARYCTKEEAAEGHRALVEEWTAKIR